MTSTQTAPLAVIEFYQRTLTRDAVYRDGNWRVMVTRDGQVLRTRLEHPDGPMYRLVPSCPLPHSTNAAWSA